MTMLEKFANKTNMFKTEGVDHIRISPFAETKIGKITSKDWRHRFFVPHIGEFTSPVCFANWLCTGDDEARHNVHYKFNETVKGYLQFVLYAKFYQLCAMKGILKREMKELPFIIYKQHASGVKEFDRWKEYPLIIKDMINHILDENKGTKVAYPWEEKFPGLEEKIQERIKAMVGDSSKNSEEESSKKKGKSKEKSIDEQIEELITDNGPVEEVASEEEQGDITEEDSPSEEDYQAG